jgi:hypothetical protein
VFKGLELVETNTFDDYGVREGDSIIALSQEESSSFDSVNLWLSLTRDDEAFNECMKWMLNQDTAEEASRLRDVHMMRMEGMPRVFNKLCTRFLDPENERVRMPPTCLSYKSAKSPSEEALPVLWDAGDLKSKFVEGEETHPSG